MSVTNPDNVVTKQDLADFYQNLLPYLGGLPEIVCNKFNKSDIYSTTEKVVGCSTNGKPIYQKTFTGTTPASGNVSITIPAYEEVIDIRGTAKWVDSGQSGYGMINMANVSPSTVAYALPSYTQGTTLYIVLNGTLASIFRSQPYVVTIQYTKTTDAANSFNYADENDYSTDEKIVGTWISGEPIYQRTFTGTLGSNGLSNLITSFSGKCIKYFGFQHGVSGSASFDVMMPSINSYVDSNNSYISYGSIMYVENSNLTYRIVGRNFSMFANQPYYITVQYTKS